MTDKPTFIPDDIAAQKPELIAFATTARGGGFRPHKDRWTELSVYWLHAPRNPGRRWAAVSAGCSRNEGEGVRESSLIVGSLDRALNLIDQGNDLGVMVCETAREWADENRVTIQNARTGAVAFDTDRAALAWLYGEETASDAFPRLLERDMGAGRSAVRMQLKADRPVMVPLRMMLPFIDRKAFRAAIEQENARG